jgi:hypothetical protein
MKLQWPSLSSLVTERVWAAPVRRDVTPAAAISPSNKVDFPQPVGPTSAIARGFAVAAVDGAAVEEDSGMAIDFPRICEFQITDVPVSD